MAHLSASNMLILVIFGLIVLLSGVVLYYLQFAINMALTGILEVITFGLYDGDIRIFDYGLPSALIGIGLISITIPFLIYFGGIVLKIFKEKTYSIKDSIILTAASFIVIRFVDFATTSLEGIDKTVPYTVMGIGFIGMIMPAAMFLGFIINNKIRNKKTLSVKDFSQVVRSLSAKDFLWIISSGVTIIILDCLLGKVHYDDKGDIPRVLADFGYVYVITPLSIYLHGVIYKIRHRKTISVKSIIILFAVGLTSTSFIGLNINMVPNQTFSIDTEPHIGDKVLHFALYFLGLSCIIISLAKAISRIIPVFKNKNRVKIKNYPESIIGYVHNKDIINEIKKIWK